MVRTQFLENYPLFYEQMPFNIKSGFTKRKHYVSIKSAQKAKTNTSNKKKGHKMTKPNTKNIKQTAIRFGSIALIIALVAVSIYLGIPRLTFNDVLSLASLIAAIALLIKSIK